MMQSMRWLRQPASPSVHVAAASWLASIAACVSGTWRALAATTAILSPTAAVRTGCQVRLWVMMPSCVSHGEGQG